MVPYPPAKTDMKNKEELAMKKILMLLAAAALLASCASGPKSEVESLPAGAKADMSAYTTYDADTDYVFVESSIREMYERTDRKSVV